MAITYTTGPMEQQGSGVTNVRVKVSNESATAVSVRIRVFDLNGTRVVIGSASFTVPANTSTFRTFNVAGTGQYEVEIELSHNENVFVSSWGRTSGGALVAAHRVVHSEMSLKNSCSDGEEVVWVEELIRREEMRRGEAIVDEESFRREHAANRDETREGAEVEREG